MLVFTLSGCVALELSSVKVESSKSHYNVFRVDDSPGSNSTSEVLDLRQVVNEEDALFCG